jgi:hypothetical protein
MFKFALPGRFTSRYVNLTLLTFISCFLFITYNLILIKTVTRSSLPM